MTKATSGLILGYHGCLASIGEKALSGEAELNQSEKDFDWLGPGIYFWEGDPDRAREWAESKAKRSSDPHAKPFVLGAAIDLGNCLDLTHRANLEYLKLAFEDLEVVRETLPKNQTPKGVKSSDKLLRYLDCAVIRHVHFLYEKTENLKFDTVRGMFHEGKEVYSGAGFYTHTHTQIAVRESSCIKGFFLPRN